MQTGFVSAARAEACLYCPKFTSSATLARRARVVACAEPPSSDGTMSCRFMFMIKSFAFVLFTSPPDVNGVIALARADLLRMNSASKLANKLVETYGDQLAAPVLNGRFLEMAIVDVNGQHELFAADLHAALSRTAKELKENARREEALPHSQAVSQPKLVEALKAVTQANQHCEVNLMIVDGDRELPVPKPQAEDFTQPIKDEPRSRTGTFKIQGIVRRRRQRPFPGRPRRLCASRSCQRFELAARSTVSVRGEERVVGGNHYAYGEKDWLSSPAPASFSRKAPTSRRALKITDHTLIDPNEPQHPSQTCGVPFGAPHGSCCHQHGPTVALYSLRVDPCRGKDLIGRLHQLSRVQHHEHVALD